MFLVLWLQAQSCMGQEQLSLSSLAGPPLPALAEQTIPALSCDTPKGLWVGINPVPCLPTY